MTRVTSLLLLACLCVPTLGRAAANVPVVDDFAIPEELGALLTATGEDGQSIVSAGERAYFDGLPSHAKQLVSEAVLDEMITAPAHLSLLFSLNLDSQKLDIVMQDNCVLCHTDAEFHDPATLFSLDTSGAGGRLSLKNFLSSVHFRHGLSCAGCHGGDSTEWMDHDHPTIWPSDSDERRQDRTWVPEFCSRCHADSTLMRQFNPALPTDQLVKFKGSRHGTRLLEEGDSRAAECTSCHGIHDIMRSASPRSKVHPTRVHETCGTCHSNEKHMTGYTLADGRPLPTDQTRKYLESVHGRAVVERGDFGAATCNDCHGNHAALPPEVASVSQICRTCHPANGILFDGSRHKEKFVEHGWPECSVCHGNHAIAVPVDEMLSDGPRSLCADCHATYAKDNPNCAATADYFYESITTLVGAHEGFSRSAEELSHKGIDVESIEAALVDLEDAVQQSRSYIHAFNLSDFREAYGPGQEAVEQLGELIRTGESTHRARLKGMLVSIGLLAVLAAFLFLKIRSLER